LGTRSLFIRTLIKKKPCIVAGLPILNS